MTTQQLKQQLKDECVRLSVLMKSAPKRRWQRLNRQLGPLLNQLDPLMGDAEAMRFYTYCEKLAGDTA